MTTVDANEVALGIESFGDDDAPLVLLAGGTTMLSWPDALCERLAAGGRRVLVLWGPGEEETARAIVRDAGHAAVLAPPTALVDMPGLLVACAALVTIDSGLKHLAVCVRVPTVTLFGATDPREWHMGGDADAFTREVMARVQDEGEAWMGGTTWHRRGAMRISVSNWSTTEADIDRTVDAILRRDYPIIQAVTLLFSAVYVLINLAVDLSYTLLDPRIRY